jgi:hypothetical protein
MSATTAIRAEAVAQAFGDLKGVSGGSTRRHAARRRPRALT